MNLRNILKAQRQSGKPPTLKQRRWTGAEQARIDQGLCVTCGKKPVPPASYLCAACEAQNSLEDIRSEIDRLRSRILGK